MRQSPKLRAAGALGALIAGAAGAQIAEAARTHKVGVGDNYFFNSKDAGPKGVTKARVGDTIRFEWAGGAGHSVSVKRAPKGAKRAKTAVRDVGATWTYKVRKKGSYDIVCTVHEKTASMKWRITAR